MILDQFAGGGTTLVEAKLLNRDIIGVDINDGALERCREKTAFDYEPAKGKVYIKKGDARNLDFVPNESIDLICTHPPYADIIKYSDDPAEYIVQALSPAQVISIDVDEEKKSCSVVVPNDQLSLAIGKEGQNARLAARLTGWKIDLRPENEEK